MQINCVVYIYVLRILGSTWPTEGGTVANALNRAKLRRTEKCEDKVWAGHINAK